MLQQNQDPYAHSPVELFEIAQDGRALRFKVRSATGEAAIVREVLCTSYYRSACCLVGEGSVVIDVGAHIGSFTVAAAARGARVLALEPVPANYALLMENIQLNGLQARVKAFNMAVWSSAGERKMPVADDSTGGSGFYYFKETVPEILVRCVRLGELMDAEGLTTCDLLKLDCEGAEFEILSMLNLAAWQRIKAIVAEYHLFAGYTLDQLTNLLIAHGFLVATQPEGVVGYLLAARPPTEPLLLRPLDVTLAESPLTRLPVIGPLWRTMRRPVHQLVVYYLNQVIVAQNRQQEQTYLYLSLLSQQAVWSRNSPNES